ncbi:hypothetical protein [Sphingobium chungbukense]|uniref:Uncharacterized protein n=1 Tax=Sphingobium chungbukense TaxID=56193 RepID=A0A0M3AJX5_9SPHN|nr:hypothetical protein [Sphingobium chungbukense]KKW90160.1 hypothetical protein YP76_22275 [Sphingobium chungbukense]
MRGILSSSPSQMAIRVLVGTHLLLLVQAVVVLASEPKLDWQLTLIIAGAALMGVSGLITAIHGGNAADQAIWRPRSRARNIKGHR